MLAMLHPFQVEQMNGEISFDLVMRDDMEFIEGVFRVPLGDWQVFIIKKSPVRDTEIAPSNWSSGASGVVINVPQSVTLNGHLAKTVLTSWSGVDSWDEVRGPDSMQLR
jgi:hypothetical protein